MAKVGVATRGCLRIAAFKDQMNAGFLVFRISPNTSHEKASARQSEALALQCSACCRSPSVRGEISVAVFEDPFHNSVELLCLAGTQLFSAGETCI